MDYWNIIKTYAKGVAWFVILFIGVTYYYEYTLAKNAVQELTERNAELLNSLKSTQKLHRSIINNVNTGSKAKVEFKEVTEDAKVEVIKSSSDESALDVLYDYSNSVRQRAINNPRRVNRASGN